MGIKGTVRRSTDGHVIHANIDTDIIIAEEPTDGIFFHVCLVYDIINDGSVHKLNKLVFYNTFPFSFVPVLNRVYSVLFCLLLRYKYPGLVHQNVVLFL